MKGEEQNMLLRLTNPFHLCDVKIRENKMRICITEFCLETSQIAVQKTCGILDTSRGKKLLEM